MDFFHPVLDIVTTVISLFSVLILIWGVTIGIKDFIVSRFRRCSSKEKSLCISRIKNVVGGYVLLSLELLIAADIIDTIVSRSMDDIIRLSVIVVIRTVISFFLNKEIMADKAELEKEPEEA